jgi:hypothetical protein
MMLNVIIGSGTSSGNTVYIPSGYCKSDFSDLRFTETDGQTLLSYWNESYILGVSAVFWPCFDAIPISPGIYQPYLYCGNPNASSTSSGPNTFPFFDHFDNGWPDGLWTGATQYGSVASSILTWADNTSFIGEYMFSIGNAGRNKYSWRASARINSVGSTGYVGFGVGDGGGQDACLTINTWYGGIGLDVGGGQGSLIPSNWTPDTWEIFQCNILGGVSARFFQNGIELENSPVTSGIPTSSTNPFLFGGNRHDQPCTVYVDWLFLKNYTANEPTWTSWGAWESLPDVTTSAATMITSSSARLNGQVTSTGLTSSCTVTVYWGTSDGGTNPGDWQHSSAPTSPSQPQGVGTFYLDIAGLSNLTQYYFSAKATNTYGTGWGTTKSFCIDATPWFNSDWLYREWFTITGSIDAELTDFSTGCGTFTDLNVVVGSGTSSGNTVYIPSGYCNSDFSDLRFTAANGVTLLGYWIMSYTSSTSATVRILFPDIPESPVTLSGYIYCGNATATSQSSIIAANLWGDDFATDTGWEVISGPGSFYVSGGSGYFVGGGLGAPATWFKNSYNLTVANFQISFLQLTNFTVVGSSFSGGISSGTGGQHGICIVGYYGAPTYDWAGGDYFGNLGGTGGRTPFLCQLIYNNGVASAYVTLSNPTQTIHVGDLSEIISGMTNPGAESTWDTFQIQNFTIQGSTPNPPSWTSWGPWEQYVKSAMVVGSNLPVKMMVAGML